VFPAQVHFLWLAGRHWVSTWTGFTIILFGGFNFDRIAISHGHCFVLLKIVPAYKNWYINIQNTLRCANFLGILLDNVYV
jgi:hypothetical protein